MAMQTGMSLSKVLILVGAGYTGSIVLRNGKLSDILGDLQALIKGLENSKESSHNDTESSHLANQLDWLSREVQRMASSRPITVLNGNSNPGNVSSLIVPLASVGVLGYGYLWWKGYSLTDFMYVTKRNMANAVSSMTKHLEQVSVALAAAKRHLTQRIENLDGKVDEQNVRLKEIKQEVSDANGKLGNIGNDIKSIEAFISSLDGKVNSIEIKQELACHGIWYLCQFVHEKGGKTPEFLLNMAKSSTGKRALGFSDSMSLKGLQHIAESMDKEKVQSNEITQIDIDSPENLKCLSRTASIKC
uniref:CMRF35-like molecule 5 n=1 Tax=Anthurium amnicola TaxID=1678845 RepID=A0A1D1YGC4_9ARAE